MRDRKGTYADTTEQLRLESSICNQIYVKHGAFYLYLTIQPTVWCHRALILYIIIRNHCCNILQMLLIFIFPLKLYPAVGFPPTCPMPMSMRGYHQVTLPLTRDCHYSVIKCSVKNVFTTK
jgi:hypothetical protein